MILYDLFTSEKYLHLEVDDASEPESEENRASAERGREDQEHSTLYYLQYHRLSAFSNLFFT